MMRHGGRFAAPLLAGALVAATAPVRAEEVKVRASYAATLGGWSVGSGELSFALDEARAYEASVTAGVTGIAALVSSRQAKGSSSGQASPSGSVPSAYSLFITGGPVNNEVEMTFSGAGNVRSISATVLRFATNNERVPLLPQHRHGVTDPLGGFVMTVPKGQDPLARTNCNRTVRVFDGRVRYDLRMTYGATSEVKDAAGYSGPALICAVAYRPIAGQRILSPEQQKFEQNLEFSIWFVPLGNSGVLLPHRMVIGTPMGLLTVNATSFTVTGAAPLETTVSAEAPPPKVRKARPKPVAQAEAAPAPAAAPADVPAPAPAMGSTAQ